MKIRVLKSEFVKLISDSTKFSSTRSQLPILENLIIKAEKSKIIVKATNLEISFYGSISAKVDEEGEIAVPAKVLLDFINNINSDKIDLELVGEVLKISASGFSAKINGINTSDFPGIPTAIEKADVKIDFEELTICLSKVLFSVSRDDTRPILTGVLMFLDSQMLSLVSSDGFRLSQMQIELKEKAGLLDKVVVPRAIFEELIKMKGSVESVSLKYNKKQNQMVFGIGDYVLSTRLIEGDFPDFSKIIPERTSLEVEVNKDDLKYAIGSMGVFARDSANVVKLQVENVGDGYVVKVAAESNRSGKGESVVEAKVEGLELSVSFNYKYINEFISVSSGESVTMKFSSETGPGLFLDTDSRFLHLIMPVRNQE